MQRETFDIEQAPVPPLREEPRHPERLDPQGHIRGVPATSSGLIRATLGSALAAGAILVFAWLPAEYGIDPTGMGRVLGLAEMGEIKQQLYAEAEVDEAALAAQTIPTAAPAPIDPALTERLDAIEAQLAAIAVLVSARPATSVQVDGANGAVSPVAPETVDTAALPTQSAPESSTVTAPAAVPDAAVPAAAATVWRDEVTYTLAPTEGIEIKLAMEEGAVAAFEWTANGAVLNHDTHGDGGGQRVSYEQGRGVPGQEGELVAAFTGNHGWFWRNRTDAPVTFTLRTRGDYLDIQLP